MKIKLRTIEIDDATATALETRAAEVGLSVPNCWRKWSPWKGAAANSSRDDKDDLDRQWAAIKAGEPTVAHDDAVRWLDTWGTSGFRPWTESIKPECGELNHGPEK